MGLYAWDGDELTVSVEEGIATLTLNRPAQLNALSRRLREHLAVALRDVEADDAVGVVIITGAGDKAFSVGADLEEFDHAPLREDEVGVDSLVMQAFAALSKPSIAAINGFAITGGFELAVNCDLLVASTKARFADTHARVGVVSAWGLTQYLMPLIGPVRARYLSFTGNYLDAATAKEWGLVLDVVEPDALLPYCRSVARDMLDCDPSTLRSIRAAMRQGLHGTLGEGLAMESTLSKASVRAFDAPAFAERRRVVMARGKRQSSNSLG